MFSQMGFNKIFMEPWQYFLKGGYLAPIEFEFKIETNGDFKISLDHSEAEKLREIPNQPGVYIWLSENIDFGKSFKDCACQKLPNEFKETIDSGTTILVKDICCCEEKFTNCNNLILIGQSKYLQNRMSYFIASLIDNHNNAFETLPTIALTENKCNKRKGTPLKDLSRIDENCRRSLHIEGARIRKLLENCLRVERDTNSSEDSQNSSEDSQIEESISLKLKVFLIPTSNEDTAKQLEAILLNIYKLLHGCLPLFNKKIEGFKLYKFTSL